MNSPLSDIGWNEHCQTLWDADNRDGFIPGRVIADYGRNYKVALPQEVTAEISGRLDYHSDPDKLPKIGDWVAFQLLDDEHGLIHDVLPRTSEISRKHAGEAYRKQVLAANVDLAFLVQAFDDDFSPERLRRYIFSLQKSGVTPVIILNKSDKVEDTQPYLQQLENFDAKIIVTSALNNYGIDEIIVAVPKHATAVFLGSSGVGKSTITNLLIGEARQVTKSIRDEDSKGRHTTTHRELFVLPNGALLIDTPGLRELQLWGDEDDLGNAFPQIDTLSRQCKFSNCTHGTEPGCAIQAAVEAGELDTKELETYFKFQSELRFLNTKVNVKAAMERKEHDKKVQKEYRKAMKTRKSQELED
jgi:ribosome biogenesis GTPase